MNKTYVNTFEGFKFKESIQKFLKILKEEVAQKRELKNVFIKYIKNIPLTEDDQQMVREQSLDILKILGMSTIFVLPGSVLIIPFLIKLCTKYNINIIPNSLRLESVTTDEVVDLIEDGKKIYVKYIQDYPNHEEEDSYKPVDIDNDGNVALSIDNQIYYTKVEWIEGIEGVDEMNFIEISPETTNPESDEAAQNRSEEWKNDLEFTELLKDQGGIKKVITKVKNEYDIDYSKCKTEEELYRALKIDKML
jgi:hypothetical protein